MTKRSAMMLLALLLMFPLSAHAASRSMRYNDNSAPDRVGRFDWGVGVSGAFNENVDDAVFLSTAIAYGVTPYIAIGVEAGWQEADGADDETVGFVPILADIIVRIPNIHESIVPYGVLGLGGAGVYVTDDDGEGSSNGDDSDDTGFAWKLGAGFDWFIDSNWIFNFEFAYWSIDVDLPLTSVGSDASYWTLGVGLKYLF